MPPTLIAPQRPGLPQARCPQMLADVQASALLWLPWG